MRKSTFFVRSFVAAPTKTNLTDSDKEKMVISFFSGDIGDNCYINDHADDDDEDDDAEEEATSFAVSRSFLWAPSDGS